MLLGKEQYQDKKIMFSLYKEKMIISQHYIEKKSVKI